MVANAAWYGAKWVRPEKRLAIHIRDDFRCAYCGRDLKHAGPGEVHLDHLRCRSAGGGNGATNLVTACRACNSGRGRRPWRTYATPGAVRHIQNLRRRKLNLALVKELLTAEPVG